MDQFECIKLQTLSKDAYHRYFPKILKNFILDRSFVHLYISNRKSFIIAYLDNYKGKEVSFKALDLTSQTPLPEKLKYFASIQYKNQVFLCGGMNTYYENPEDQLSDQFQQCYDESFLFNMKQFKLQNHSRMVMKRAKHCLALCQDPKDQYNQLILSIGGIYINQHRDLFLKKTFEYVHDTDLVEFYSLKDLKWDTFNAKLSIARHSASSCVFKEHIYVIGGHNVKNPSKFINTVERCNTNGKQSFFEVISIHQNFVNLQLQNQLCVALNDDNGILMISHSSIDPNLNQGFFIDIKEREMKQSKFDFSVGSINHWHNSYEIYEKRINFLTENMQILRFEYQSCQWSLFDLAVIEREKEEQIGYENRYGSENYDDDMFNYPIQEDGSHHYYKDQFQRSGRL